VLFAAIAWLATVAYKKLAPDVKRYVEMSRM
jgi:hypothetical protein